MKKSNDLCKYIFAFIVFFDILCKTTMTNARIKILNYILEQQTTTVDELSKVFRVTPANIRHHLSVLSEQGAVKIIGQKANIGKGRPTQIYSSAQQVDQNNIDQLAGTLFSMLLRFSQPDETARFLQEIAKQMVSRYPLDKYNPTRRLYSSIRVLNHMKYQAHWEAHVDDPHIMLGHCPYQAILGQHPQICQLDTFILQELLDTPVHQAEKRNLNTKGLPECVFLFDHKAVA
jgi:predicted ArsR family transcriptional regulator